MKTIKQIIFGLAIFTTMNIYGQDLIDSNGDKVASINSSGIIVDGANQPYGEFLSNGNVNNAAGQLMGSIDGNEFKDPGGTVLGKIDTNNNVFDINNSKIGSIQAGILVIDANNHVVGRASAPIESKIMAAYFFFFFNNSNM
jgi:5-fold beta-flower protein